jgi:hypothetical protein
VKEVFDLTEVSRANYAHSRPFRITALAVAGAMVVLAVVGLIIILQGVQSNHSFARDFGGAALLVGGVFITVQFATLYQFARAGSERLTLDDESLKFEASPNRPDLLLDWTTPHLNLVVIDLRPLGETTKSGRKRSNMFAILPRPRYYVPLTQPAFEAIIRRARGHNLRIVGETEPPAGRGPSRRIRIRPA